MTWVWQCVNFNTVLLTAASESDEGGSGVMISPPASMATYHSASAATENVCCYGIAMRHTDTLLWCLEKISCLWGPHEDSQNHEKRKKTGSKEESFSLSDVAWKMKQSIVKSSVKRSSNRLQRYIDIHVLKPSTVHVTSKIQIFYIGFNFTFFHISVYICIFYFTYTESITLKLKSIQKMKILQ